MAYIRVGENESNLGSFGCGSGCRCSGCRQTAAMSGLGELYVPEEPEQDEAPPPPQPPQTPPQHTAPPTANVSGWGRFGEPPRRRPSLKNGLQLRTPAFATLTGFTRGGASLSAAQLERVNRVAEFVAQSWNGTSPITSIRITGYIDADEWQPDLGERRAVAVPHAPLGAAGAARPGP